MSELIPDNPTPQFQTAEYAGDDRCQFCHQQVAGSYYRVNGAMTCAACAQKIKAGAPTQTFGAFGRAMFFGSLAAVAGLVLYSAFAIITGWMIGYVALAVGYIIAKAMMKGSRGFGGRRYQIAAVLLTYGAVSLSAIPIYISQEVKKQREHKQVIAAKHKPASEQEALEQEFGKTPSLPSADAVKPEEPKAVTAPAPQTEDAAQPAEKKMTGAEIGKAFVVLVAVGLASPFLELADPIHGAIGLVILFVGIQIAWRIAAGKVTAQVEGPY